MNKVNQVLPYPAIAALTLALVVSAPAAHAQALQNPAQLNIPYGKSYNDFNQPFDPRTRDGNGNRTIINGRILTGDQSTLSGGIGGSFFSGGGSFGSFGGFGGIGSGGAIGNQLNVITNGSWNTVIIDSTQINNGDQTVNLNGNINTNSTGSGTSTSNGATPPLTALATDGPFRVAPQQTLRSRRQSQAAPGNDGELNGGISLDD